MNTITHWLLTAALVLLAAGAGAQTATSDGDEARILKGQWQTPPLERAD